MRIALLLALVMAAGAWGHPTAPASRGAALSAQPSLSVIRSAPDFELTDTDGRLVRLANYRGRVVLIAFVYSTCTDACPMLTYRMAQLQAMLKAAGLYPRRTAFVSISVDPERDTAEVIAAYSDRFSVDRAGWAFLTDRPERARQALLAYGEWTKPLAGGGLDHPARLHLIDSQGKVREIYSLAFFDARQAYLDIQALLTEPQ